jgi:hypothetical protein
LGAENAERLVGRYRMSAVTQNHETDEYRGEYEDYDTNESCDEPSPGNSRAGSRHHSGA